MKRPKTVAKTLAKSIAIYVRVSTEEQNTAGQIAELQKWVESQERPVVWFTDHFSGESSARPALEKLWAAIDRGEIEKIVVWKLDRLGRSTLDLHKQFRHLIDHKVELVSLTESINLTQASGRLMAEILAAFASFETDIRRDRQRIGIEAAKVRGDVYKGRRKGAMSQRTRERLKDLAVLRRKGVSLNQIARSTGLSICTVRRHVRNLSEAGE